MGADQLYGFALEVGFELVLHDHRTLVLRIGLA